MLRLHLCGKQILYFAFVSLSGAVGAEFSPVLEKVLIASRVIDVLLKHNFKRFALLILSMAWKEKEIEKLYYTIGEVALMLDVNTSLLRYWEKEFDVLKPKKNTKGDRFFTKDDIEKIKLIYHLVREKGYTLDGAKSRLKTDIELTQKKFRIIERLKKVRGFLEELKEQID